jgi:hypothetical protein
MLGYQNFFGGYNKNRSRMNSEVHYAKHVQVYVNARKGY